MSDSDDDIDDYDRIYGFVDSAPKKETTTLPQAQAAQPKRAPVIQASRNLRELLSPEKPLAKPPATAEKTILLQAQASRNLREQVYVV